jgi:DNA-binding MarR family transcriptional regulator
MDLTPFGFTPTEALAYTALLDRGPTSAYALAKLVGAARANIYQALNGLVSKGAALLVSRNPQIFRPIGPSELLALVSERQLAKLDQLESEIRARERPGEPTTVPFVGQRSFGELALRTAVRAATVVCIAPVEILTLLTPVWRKRIQDQAETVLWSIGDQAWDPPGPVAGTIDTSVVESYFGAPAALLTAARVALVGRQTSDKQLSGYWSSDPILVGAVRGTIDLFIGG